MKRRTVLQAGASALAGWALPRRGVAAPTAAPRLICIALRGGLDALALLPPVESARYRQLRSSTALSRERVLSLDGHFIHPALAPLMPMLLTQTLGLVDGVGLEAPTRAHGLAWRSLEGALALTLTARGGGRLLALTCQAPSILAHAVPVEHEPADPPPAFGFASTLLGRRLARAAQALEQRPELTAVLVESPSWDTHAAQGAENGSFAEALGDLAAGLVALRGNAPAGIRAFTITEFGRTPAENLLGGTDDGGATAMLYFGTGLTGGLRVSPPNLDNPFALPATRSTENLIAALVSDGVIL